MKPTVPDLILALFQTKAEWTIPEIADALNKGAHNLYKPVSELVRRNEIHICKWIKYEGGWGGPKTAVYTLGPGKPADKITDCITMQLPTSQQLRKAEQQAVDVCAIQELIIQQEIRKGDMDHA